jgi:hypothetical protein
MAVDEESNLIYYDGLKVDPYTDCANKTIWKYDILTKKTE